MLTLHTELSCECTMRAFVIRSNRLRVLAKLVGPELENYFFCPLSMG